MDYRHISPTPWDKGNRTTAVIVDQQRPALFSKHPTAEGTDGPISGLERKQNRHREKNDGLNHDIITNHAERTLRIGD